MWVFLKQDPQAFHVDKRLVGGAVGGRMIGEDLVRFGTPYYTLVVPRNTGVQRYYDP